MLGGRGGREHSSTSVAHGATAGPAGRRRRRIGFVADLPVGRRGCGTHGRQPDSAGVVHLCDGLCGTGRSICPWEWPQGLDDDGGCACRLDRRRSDLVVLRNYSGAQSTFRRQRTAATSRSLSLAGLAMALFPNGPLRGSRLRIVLDGVTVMLCLFLLMWTVALHGTYDSYIAMRIETYPLCSYSFRSATSWC